MKKTYFQMTRRAARIEAAEKAKRDERIQTLKAFYMEALNLTPEKALAKAREVCGEVRE